MSGLRGVTKPHLYGFFVYGRVMWRATQKHPRCYMSAASVGDTPAAAISGLGRVFDKIDKMFLTPSQSMAIEGYQQVGPC